MDREYYPWMFMKPEFVEYYTKHQKHMQYDKQLSEKEE